MPGRRLRSRFQRHRLLKLPHHQPNPRPAPAPKEAVPPRKPEKLAAAKVEKPARPLRHGNPE